MEQNDNSAISSQPSVNRRNIDNRHNRRQKIVKDRKNTEIIPLLLILTFGFAIFFLLTHFQIDKPIINLFLINIIAVFVGYCCWFFLGRIEGSEFEIFNFKIKTVTGSFFVYLFVFTMGFLFFKTPETKLEVSNSDNIIKALAEYSGLDLKIKVEPTKSSPFILNNFVEASKFITSISTSPSDIKPQKVDIVFELPDSLETSKSKIFLYVNKFTYQKLINPNSNTAPLSLIANWAEFNEDGGYRLFQRPFQKNTSISLLLWE